MHAWPSVAAKALITDWAGRVLLVKPSYKPHWWDLPGGYVEAGETPTAACGREVREELAITVPIGRLLVADWAPASGEGDRLCLVFDGGRLDDAQMTRIELNAVELSHSRFVERSGLAGLLSSKLIDRVEAAYRAREEDATVYRD